MPEGDDWPGLARQWAFAHFEMRKRWLDHLSEQLGPSAPLVRVAARDEHAAECRFRQEQGESGRLRELDEAVMGATPLRRLASLYGLVDRDLRLLLLMAVVAEDARLRRVASTMTEAVPGLEEMLRIVAATGGAETRHGALELWGFLDETPTGATVPSWCRAWTLGVNVVEPLARALLHPLERRPALSTWPVKALTQQIEAVLRQGRPVRVVIRGQARSGRATFAAEVAHTLGLRSAEVTGFPSPNEARAIVRQCMWSDMAPVLRDEAWLDLARRCLPPLQFVTQRPDAACSSQPHAVDVHVALPPAPREELLDLWKASVAELPWRERVLEALAWRQDLSPSDPDRVARSCPPDAASAMALLDADRRDRLTGLATKLTTPFSMEDLVVGNPTREELERLIHEAKARLTIGRKPEVARLMGGETGLVALFHGPPGTGKTMAARVVGQTLGFDVYLVDMSSLVSKWVGETMKHTAAILEAAQSLDVVLFFDEADALFGRRTEGNDAADRHINTDVSFLLQAIETFRGVVILSSNRPRQVDHAFLRRFRRVVAFDRPTEDVRLRMWETFVSQLGRAHRSTLASLRDLAVLDLAGAEIKNALLSAAYESDRLGKKEIDLPTVLDGIQMELAKSGRGLSSRELKRLQEVGS